MTAKGLVEQMHCSLCSYPLPSFYAIG